MILKYKANTVASQFCGFLIIEQAGFFTIDKQFARGRPVKQPNDVKQCAFPGARGAGKGDKIAAPQLQIKPVQNLNSVRPTHVIGFGDVLKLENDRIFNHGSPPQGQALPRV